jgi:hypothetical protein
MSTGAILGTAIGLVFLFAVTALLCSAICEAIANVLQMRAKYLLRGLRTMLDSTVTKSVRAPDAGSAVSPVSEEPMRALQKKTIDPKAAIGAADSVNTMAMDARAEAAGDTTAVSTRSPARIEIPLQTGGLTLALFGHPLVRSLQTCKVGLLGDHARNPSYLAPATFARVLIDTLVPDDEGETTLVAVRATVEKLPDGLPAKSSLLALLRRSGNELAHFERLVEAWYDEHMSRVTGWYKRWTKLVLAMTGLVVAILVNVDTVQVARQLYVNEPVRAAVLSQVNEANLCRDETDPVDRAACAQDEVAKLEASGLPLWWSSDTNPGDAGDWAAKILGFLLTAFAVSFGAPFWFDALSKLGSLRTAGPKPSSGPEGTSAR